VQKISEARLIPGDAGCLNSAAKEFNSRIQIERVLELLDQIGVKLHF
jgi:hypothetical protein